MGCIYLDYLPFVFLSAPCGEKFAIHSKLSLFATVSSRGRKKGRLESAQYPTEGCSGNRAENTSFDHYEMEEKNGLVGEEFRARLPNENESRCEKKEKK